LRVTGKTDIIRLIIILRGIPMKNLILRVLMFLAVASIFSGCAAGPAVSPGPMCLEGIGQAQLMKTTEQVLVGMCFQLEKYDTDAGYIRTRPLRAGQFFEPWRSDNSDGGDIAEANLQSLQRTAELRFTTQAAGMCVECSVQVRRLSIPPEPIRGTAGTAGLYTDSTRTKQSLRLESDQDEKMEWTDMGSDHNLEARILSKIKQQIQKTGRRALR